MRRLGNVLIGLGFVIAFGWMFLFGYFADTSLPTPDAKSGQLIGINNHGHVGYITGQQSTALEILSDTALVIGILGGLLSMAAERRGQ